MVNCRKINTLTSNVYRFGNLLGMKSLIIMTSFFKIFKKYNVFLKIYNLFKCEICEDKKNLANTSPASIIKL